MLSIGKIGASQAQQEYYENQVAKSREDYYQGSGEAPGEWWGSAAEQIGLSGISSGDQLRNLFAGRHPVTGEQLRSTRGNVKVHGLDLTFSAPKSISILYAAGDEQLQQKLVEAHEYAVNQAMGYMEREAARVVRGHSASTKDREEGIEDTLTTHRANGFTAIKYRHRRNRLQDPQLHTHVVVGNFAQGEDGRWTSLAATHIYEHAKAGGHVYQAALRHKAHELVDWVRWGKVENGMAELADDLIHPEIRKAFSQRSADIKEFVEEYLGVPGGSSRGLRQYATLQTRKPKIGAAVVEQEWREDIAARLADFNFSQDTIRTYEQGGAHIRRERVDLNQLATKVFSANGVTATSNTFERKDVVIQLTSAHQEGLPDLASIDTRVEQLMGDGQVLFVETKDLRDRHTTRELRDTEKRLLLSAVSGKAAGRARLTDEQIAGGLDAFHASINHEYVLSDEQQSVVRGVLSDGNAISSIEALAGSGKTTSAKAMRLAFEQAGYRTFGMGPTGRAVRELADVGFAKPHTLSWWEMKFHIGGDRHGDTLAQIMGDPSRAVAFVDEAGMTDSRLLSNVVGAMADQGVKVVLIGDSKQLPSVRAGGMLRGITRLIGSYRLSEVRRQRNVAERNVLAGIRRGHTSEYLDFKKTLRGDEWLTGRPDLEVFTGQDSEQTATHQAVVDFLQVRDRMIAEQPAAAQVGRQAAGAESVALITKDNTRRQQLNQAIRRELIARGELTQHRHFGHKDGRPLEWSVGDRVIARKNHHGYDLDNGSRGTIVAISDSELVIKDDRGGQRAVDADYVSEHLEHAYVLTAHGTQGATLEWAGVIGLPSDFTKEWAYTALTRAKEPTHIYLVGGYTLAEKERQDYATVPAPEEDVEKLEAAMSRQMKKRDAQDTAVENLMRAEARRDAEAATRFEEAEQGEVLIPWEEQLWAQTQTPHQHVLAVAGAPEGPKLIAYAQVRANLARLEAEMGSDIMQDAVAAAELYQHLEEDIQRTVAGQELDALSPARQANLTGWRQHQAQILARYPNPDTILRLAEQQRIRLAYLQTTLPQAREAALIEHMNSPAGQAWLSAIPTRGQLGAMGEVWDHVTRHRAGDYIDHVADPARAHAHTASPEIATAAAATAADSRVQTAEHALVLAEAGWGGSGDLNAFNQVIAARHQWAAAVLDTNPPWLHGAIGQAPESVLLRERWQSLGEHLAGIRRERGVTSLYDHGVIPAHDPALIKAIERFRLDAGLQGPDVDQNLAYGQ